MQLMSCIPGQPVADLEKYMLELHKKNTAVDKMIEGLAKIKNDQAKTSYPQHLNATY